MVGQAPIPLAGRSVLLYAEGVFGTEARKSAPMRAKTADGVLRYAPWNIAGVVDSQSKEPTAGAVLGTYLEGTGRENVPVLDRLVKADVLMLGAAPEGGELPPEWEGDILRALERGMDVVSGMHYALKEDERFVKAAEQGGGAIWDVRTDANTSNIPLCSSAAYHVKVPVVLTVGTDAALGKMTAAYELQRALDGSRLVPTGQTAMMIEGWGVAVDALAADFMAGAAEKMVLEASEGASALFVEGQGSLFHPAFSNTSIALLHGAVPSHLVLVHRPQRKHSVGSKLVKLPSLKKAIDLYERSVLPSYRGTKVAAVALNSSGMTDRELASAVQKSEQETGLPSGDVLRTPGFVDEVIGRIQ